MCSSVTTCYRKVLGTMLTLKAVCMNCGPSRKWDSQPKVGGMPVLNILLSAAILFTGSIPSKVFRLFSSLNIATHVPMTFFRDQRKYLHDAVKKTWTYCQAYTMETLKSTDLVFWGDARCDSMGHSAKFGSYAILELNNNKILTTELVQSNEVGGSYHMELEGLKRCLPLFSGYTIKAFITDRHRQVGKGIREVWKVPHFYDCWHVVKGLCKKMEDLAKKKPLKPIQEWIKSIKYHLYWCVMSSPEGDGEAFKKKWLSCMEHVRNVHDGCSHGKITTENKWLKDELSLLHFTIMKMLEDHKLQLEKESMGTA